MISLRNIRWLLIVTLMGWGAVASIAQASMVAADQAALAESTESVAEAPRLEKSLPQRWLDMILAVLSPDQRDQLRNQIREQRQQMREERRQQTSDDDNWRGEPQRPQHLSPDERKEFHQWMRERRRSDFDGDLDERRRGR